MAVHYAPRTPGRPGRAGRRPPPLPPADRLAVLAVGRHDERAARRPAVRIDLPEPADAARSLYESLHRLDAAGADLILVLMPPDRPAWSAVRDRLRRATAPA